MLRRTIRCYNGDRHIIQANVDYRCLQEVIICYGSWRELERWSDNDCDITVGGIVGMAMSKIYYNQEMKLLYKA